MIWVIIYAGLCILLLTAIVAIGFIVSRRYRTYRDVKSMRFEAGNPPMDRVKKKLIMQYFGYVFMAVCLECVTLYMLVLSICREVTQLVMVLAPCLVLTTLAILLGLRYVSRLEEWV
ncbi:MAG: hypothetical protein GXO23_06985 [Crenarchaeota archaeon]|nr:hypothetical protein [Thermoproteota archaeon]